MRWPFWGLKKKTGRVDRFKPWTDLLNRLKEAEQASNPGGDNGRDDAIDFGRKSTDKKIG